MVRVERENMAMVGVFNILVEEKPEEDVEQNNFFYCILSINM